MAKQLNFDATSALSFKASDKVGAYLLDPNNDRITSTLVGSKQALDVNVASGINVEVDLAHTDDSVRLGDGTNFFTSTTIGADIGLDVNIINANIEVTQGTSPWVVSGTVGISGTVAVTQSTTPWVVSDAALADAAILSSANTLGVADTAELVVASALASRKYLYIYNDDKELIYIGGSGVTEANGFPMAPKDVMKLRAGPSCAVYFVGESGSTPKLRALELS